MTQISLRTFDTKVLNLRSNKFRPAHGGADFCQNFGHHMAAQIFAKISAITRRHRFSPKFRPSHGGADFRQNFGPDTAAQIFAKTSALTRQRRFSPKFRPSHGGADFRQILGHHTAAQIFVFASFRFRFVLVYVLVRFCLRFRRFVFFYRFRVSVLSFSSGDIIVSTWYVCLSFSHRFQRVFNNMSKVWFSLP